jgi:hypothetical protein
MNLIIVYLQSVHNFLTLCMKIIINNLEQLRPKQSDNLEQLRLRYLLTAFTYIFEDIILKSKGKTRLG